MEKEKLIIKNFGPIKSVELDLGRFNILIGEQATGKSTVAKVLAVCRYFSYISSEDEIFSPFLEGIVAWGMEEYINKNTSIYYSCKHYQLLVKSRRILATEDENNIETSPSYFNLVCKTTPRTQVFTSLIDANQSYRPKNFPPLIIPPTFFQNEVPKVMHNPCFLPTERGLQSIFSIGKGGIQNLSDALFIQFSKIANIADKFRTDTYIEPLDIYYKNVKGYGRVKKYADKKFFSIFNVASGWQSAIPIVLSTRYYSEKKKKEKTFIIEEPELNLFPTAQDKLMQYLVDKTMNFSNSILLTTHSPYVLASINNMMYAYQVGQKYPEKVSSIIGKKHWLNPDEVSVYLLKSDGTYEDIFDREEGMIKAEKIDSVSTEINKIFDKLLNIEFKKNELNT